MDKVFTALLLLKLSKNEIKIFLLLHMLYKNIEEKERAYTIEDMEELSGLSRDKIIKILNSFETKNILGKLVFEHDLVEKRVAEGFSEDFINTLFDKKNPVKDAIDRVGYHIVDDDYAYVLNPSVKSWKYPAKAKLMKHLNRLEKVFDKDDFIKYLKNSLNKKTKTGKKFCGRKSANKKINGWSIYGVIQEFLKKYKYHYNANYVVNENTEYNLMKQALLTLSTNNIKTKDLDKFLDYAFKKAKGKKAVLHIANLKYYANEFSTNVIKKNIHNSNYYYDEKGNRYRKQKA